MALFPCRECGQRVARDARMCPCCGKLHPTKRSSRMGKFIFAVLLFWTVFWVFSRPNHNPRQALGGATPPAISRLETAERLASGLNTAESPLLSALRTTYPDMQAKHGFGWGTVYGSIQASIPDQFWDQLTSAQRQQLAAELDAVLGTSNWEIVTGRYMGDGKMMLDRSHSRSEVLAGR